MVFSGGGLPKDGGLFKDGGVFKDGAFFRLDDRSPERDRLPNNRSQKFLDGLRDFDWDPLPIWEVSPCVPDRSILSDSRVERTDRRSRLDWDGNDGSWGGRLRDRADRCAGLDNLNPSLPDCRDASPESGIPHTPLPVHGKR
jgi:hypothetical protein